MSDFLRHLTDRALSRTTGLRPTLPSVFEPPKGAMDVPALDVDPEPIAVDLPAAGVRSRPGVARSEPVVDVTPLDPVVHADDRRRPSFPPAPRDHEREGVQADDRARPHRLLPQLVARALPDDLPADAAPPVARRPQSLTPVSAPVDAAPAPPIIVPKWTVPAPVEPLPVASAPQLSHPPRLPALDDEPVPPTMLRRPTAARDLVGTVVRRVEPEPIPQPRRRVEPQIGASAPIASVHAASAPASLAADASVPTIHVTIGRVEVRATPPPAARPRPAVASPALPLAEYLRRRTSRDAR